jgi:hypothetical protein
MMEAQFYYVIESLESAVDALLTLPGALKPAWFSLDESKKVTISVNDGKKLRSAISKAKSGFFLHADKVSYSFLITQASDFEIGVSGLDSSQAKALADQLGRANAVFGYVAEWDERLHRNRLTKKASYGLDETWVGRDWRRYVPGVYWLTLVSERLLQMHSVPVEPLLAAAKSEIAKLDNGSYIFRFFESANEWRSEAQRLDDLCENVPGFFAISRVRPAFEQAGTFLETAEAIHGWR